MAAVMRPSCWLLMLIALATGASAASLDRASELRRISRDRAAAEARFDAARRRCELQFVVTACLDEARAERRSRLEQLQREQSVLDDAERRQRAAARLRSIEDRTRASDDRGTAPPSTKAKPAASHLAPVPHAPRAAPKVDPAAEAAQRADAAKRQQAGLAQRQREAEGHRQKILLRNAARDKVKPPSAPLPAASVPAPTAKPASR